MFIKKTFTVLFVMQLRRRYGSLQDPLSSRFSGSWVLAFDRHDDVFDQVHSTRMMIIKPFQLSTYSQFQSRSTCGGTGGCLA